MVDRMVGAMDRSRGTALKPIVTCPLAEPDLDVSERRCGSLSKPERRPKGHAEGDPIRMRLVVEALCGRVFGFAGREYSTEPDACQ